MWNERYFGASAKRACRADYQAWLLAQTEKVSSGGIWRLEALFGLWFAHLRARENDRSHGLSWIVRTFLPPSRLASRTSWGSSFARVWPQGQN